MPINVQCPNGCKLRVPVSRAGKVIRCPGCKATIRLAPLSRAKKRNVNQDEAEGDERSSQKASGRLPTIELISSAPTIGNELEISVDETGELEVSGLELRTRAVESRGDRMLLARIFAALLCVVAVINLIPATYCWYRWVQTGEPLEWTRWMYLQVFVASLHFVYAIFLIQIPDWSALKSVAVAMLVLAVVFGAVSTSLLLDSGTSALMGFLELPVSLATRAAIWCVAMLCLSTLISYLSGREALNWQRTEVLLREILETKTKPGSALEQ